VIHKMRFYAVTTSNFAGRALQYTCVQVTGFLLQLRASLRRYNTHRNAHKRTFLVSAVRKWVCLAWQGRRAPAD